MSRAQREMNSKRIIEKSRQNGYKECRCCGGETNNKDGMCDNCGDYVHSRKLKKR